MKKTNIALAIIISMLLLTTAVSAQSDILPSIIDYIKSFPKTGYTVLLEDTPKTIKIPEAVYVDNEMLDLRESSYNGYIIEFKEKPIIEYKVGIEQNIEEKRTEISEFKKDVELMQIAWYDVGGHLSKFFKKRDVSEKQRNLDNSIKNVPNLLKNQENKITNLHALAEKDINSLSMTDIATTKKIKIFGKFKKVFSGLAVNITDEKANEIKKLDYVKKVYPNYEVNITLMESIPLIDADDVWQLDEDGNDCSVSSKPCLTGEGIIIAIIDTGIDYTHPDLGACFGSNCKVIDGYDFVNEDGDPMDDHGHGTHCAGISAGNGALKGVAPDARLLAYKVLSSGGSGYLDWVIGGVERAVDPNQDGDFSDHADIISMSLGASGNPDDPVSTAIDNVVDMGVVAVIAAGNSGPSENTIASPGTARKAITVGATYKIDYNGQYWYDTDPKQDQITSFSSRGPVMWEGGIILKPDIVAPGAIICSSRYDNLFPEGKHPFYKPCLDEQHVQLAGTSMATPMVAGAAALLKQKNPEWSPEEIKMALKNTAIDLGYDINTQGYGRINILEAIKLDNAPPIAEIMTSGKVQGTEIDVTGTARADNLNEYRLFYAKGTDISSINWIEICSSIEQVNDDVLCKWDIRTLNDDFYTLKLIVKNQDQESIVFGFIDLQNIEIINPQDLRAGFYWDVGEVFPSWKGIEIRGSSVGYNFDYYKIEWNKKYTKDWSTEGITLSENGYTPINNGILGVWDTSSLESSDRYYIRLTTYFKGREENSEEVEIYVDTKIQNGWPRFLDRSLLAFIDQPTIADIDKDNKKDLITAYLYKISVFKYNGEQARGWPKEIDCLMQIGPAVADLDKDGFNEIVAGDNCGSIHVLNHDGSYINGWPKKICESIINGIAISDVDNDGEYEIIFGCEENLYILKPDGTNLIEPKTIGHFPFGNSGLAIGDIDNDGYKEIVVRAKNSISVFDYHERNLIEDWSKTLSYHYFDPNVIIADIDQKNRDLEIITFDKDTVYIWDKNGNDIEGWPQKVDACFTRNEDQILYGSAVGDINNDNELEIIIFGRYSCIYALTHKGEKAEGFWPMYKGYIGIGGRSKPLLNDVYGNENIEIPLPNTGEGVFPGDLPHLYALRSDGNTMLLSFIEDGIMSNGLPMADLDGDGDAELIALTYQKGNLFVWDLPVKSGRGEWPQFSHDSMHTSKYTFLKPSLSDYIITDINWTPEKLKMDEDVDLFLKYKNIGRNQAEGDVILRLELNDEVLSESPLHLSLLPEENGTIIYGQEADSDQFNTEFFKLAKAGSNKITATIDFTNAIEESDEDNNIKVGYMEIIADTSPCDYYGDLNDDGYITDADLDGIKQCILGNCTTEQKLRADVNGDTEVNVLDLVALKRYILELDETFNVCKKCTDLDGGKDYYTKGKLSAYYNDEISFTNEDYCMDTQPGFLAEMYCENNDYKTVEYQCQTGCENGACIVAKTSPCDFYGDLNDDGYITDTDSELINQCILGQCTSEQLLRADLNQDDLVNVLDSTALKRFIIEVDETFTACSLTSPCDSYGDLNDNGYVNLIDLDILQPCILGQCTSEQELRADVNGDERVNVLDLVALKRYISGVDETLSVCS